MFQYIKLLFIYLMLFISSNIYGEERQKNIYSFYYGLNSNYAYDAELSYHYFLNKYIGIGGGIGYYSQWNNDYSPEGETNKGKWNSWKLCDCDKKILKLYINPSVIINSPTLFSIKNFKCNIGIEPNLILQIPYSNVDIKYFNSGTSQYSNHSISTTKGKFVYGSLKGMINLINQSFIISLGYSISNLDIYSSYRKFKVENTSFDEFYPKKSITNTIFLQASIPF